MEPEAAAYHVMAARRRAAPGPLDEVSAGETLAWVLLGALLTSSLLGMVACARGSSRAERPNVILVVIDSIRKDRIGAYGAVDASTPNIDGLAEVSVKYTRAVSQSPWTTPSVGSLLTSRYASGLGVRDLRSGLSDELILLPEVLKRVGYTTGAVVSHSFCASERGFAQGFDLFDEENILGARGISSPGVSDAGIAFIQKHAGGPFFLFLHYFDPHFAYIEHDGFARPSEDARYRGPIHSAMPIRALYEAATDLNERDLRELNRIYDSEVSFTDHHIGRVLAELRRLGLFESSFIVLTGDHGEEFRDHGGFGHTKTLYEELVNVPLLIKYPGSEPAVVRSPVGLINIYPTVLDYLDISVEHDLSGRSLLEPLREEGAAVYTETSRQATLRGVVAGRFKLILDLERQGQALFDVVRDPEELRDLSEEDPQRAHVLRGRLERWMAEVEESSTPGRVTELSPRERERLRSLGYVE
jgi:arylsulfatase A-like enzyme